MSTEEIKAKFRWFYEEVFEKGNMNAWDELFSSDYIEHPPPFGDFKGLEAIKEGMKEERSALSGFHATIEEIIVEGNTIVVRHNFVNTQVSLWAFPRLARNSNAADVAYII